MTDTIVRWLVSVGIEVECAELGEDTFLPGVRVGRGRLLVDPRRLHYPGDLLHEAGHLAILPPSLRARFGGDEQLESVDMAGLEVQAGAWSYAASLAIGIEPTVVFHDGGYGGHAPGMLRSFSLGVFYGVTELERAGLTAGPRLAAELGVAPFPHMLRWLRESEDQRS